MFYGVLNEVAKIINGTSKYTGYPLTNKSISGMNIAIGSENQDTINLSLQHLEQDIKAINLKELIANDEKKNGKLDNKYKLYEIVYHYQKYNDKYSPTGKADMFGEFEFCYETKDNSLPPIAITALVYNGKVVKQGSHNI